VRVGEIGDYRQDRLKSSSPAIAVVFFRDLPGFSLMTKMTTSRGTGIVVVLGMHRSGTSAMTYALTTMGVDLGNNLIPAQADNERGFWEDADILHFNERLFTQAGCTWDSLQPDLENQLSTSEYIDLRADAVDLLAEKMQPGGWLAIKDPRFSRLLPFWLDVFSSLETEVRFLHGIRNPLSVARSLESRNGFELTKGLFLWLVHVISVVIHTQGFRQSVVDFDHLMADPHGQVQRLAQDLGLTQQLDITALDRYANRFLAPELRHAQANIKELREMAGAPPLVAEVYASLLELTKDDCQLDKSSLQTEFRAYRERLASYQPLLALLADRETQNRVLTERVERIEDIASNRGAEIRELRSVIEARDATIGNQHGYILDLEGSVNNLEHRVVNLENERAAMISSTSWRITRPIRAIKGIASGHPHYWNNLRSGLGSLPGAELILGYRPVRVAAGLLRRNPNYWARLRNRLGFMAPLLPDLARPADELAQALTTEETDGAFRVVYISGEPHTPGHGYRVLRYAEAAKAAGASVTIIPVGELSVRMQEITKASLVIIWRAEWSQDILKAVSKAKSQGARILFDVDDLMFVPRVASVRVIDGIRSQGLTEEQVASFYGRIRETMLHADFCTVTTTELATHARRLGLSVRVLPNGFDEASFLCARQAARAWAATRDDDAIRIGYAGGSRTHQRDFLVCVEAVAAVLRAEPRVRLVLFKVESANARLIDIEEFPALEGLEDRIEWREMVPLERLAEETARFDINLAPLEVDNPFCEAKSELKYFEAALVGVPTLASPTGPFRRCIRHGETGLLAASPAEWLERLRRLVREPKLRETLAANALRDVLWTFGPERRAELMFRTFDILRGGRRGAHAFAEGLVEKPPCPSVEIPPHRILFKRDSLGIAEATVVVPLFNYAHLLPEALDSVLNQSLPRLDLIVIDDGSRDDGVAVACRWAEQHAERFNRLLVVQNIENTGLGPTRNLGFALAESLHVLPLDPDNRLLPDCLERCLAKIQAHKAAFVYPVIRLFGDEVGVIGNRPYDPNRFIQGNYIDAMALISKSAWTLVGGYAHVRFGWEDYDFWCRLAERGLCGVALGGQPAAEYRVHGASMLRKTTDISANKSALIADMMNRHAWLSIPSDKPFDVSAL
jgi:hypothetical protein